MGHYRRGYFTVFVNNRWHPTLKAEENHLGRVLRTIYKEKVHECDTSAGMFSLNTKVFEFEDEAETDYGWVRPLELDGIWWKMFYDNVMSGLWGCRVHYYDENGKLEEHH